MWQDLVSRLRLMVMRGRVTLAKDGGAAQLLQTRVNVDWRQDDVPRLAEYGFQSVPPAGADVVLLCLAGNPTDAVVIATGHQQYRVRNLASGEVCLSDNQGQKVYLSAAGIRIEGAGLPIEINTTGSLTINAGSLAVNANTAFTGTVTANGVPIGSTHRHTSASPGTPTSTPVP